MRDGGMDDDVSFIDFMFFNEHKSSYNKGTLCTSPAIGRPYTRKSPNSLSDPPKPFHPRDPAHPRLHPHKATRLAANAKGMLLQLPADERERLQAICTPIELTSGQVLEHAHSGPGEALVHFLDQATVSLWIEPAQQQGMAVGLAGRGAVVGCSNLWPERPVHWAARVLVPGAAWVTPAHALRERMAESPALVLAMSQFLWWQTQEIAQLAARMMLGDIRTRLALWLHLIHYKSGLDTLPLTHEALARMLGTRRVSITLAAGELQSQGVITQQRGTLRIHDVRALERIAGLPG